MHLQYVYMFTSLLESLFTYVCLCVCVCNFTRRCSQGRISSAFLLLTCFISKDELSQAARQMQSDKTAERMERTPRDISGDRWWILSWVRSRRSLALMAHFYYLIRYLLHLTTLCMIITILWFIFYCFVHCVCAAHVWVSLLIYEMRRKKNVWRANSKEKFAVCAFKLQK